MPLGKLSVSVVIPNYNGRKLLERHLPAVLAACDDCEIIVVDDASKDSSVEFLHTQYPQVKTVLHTTNRRFAVACNSGVAAATGEIVVLLNSDVSPEKDFLPPLLAAFEDPTVFAVGCLEKQKGGGESGRARAFFRRGLLTHEKHPEQVSGSTAWVSGGSGAFRRSMWNELDGMDWMFRPAYEEDRDICYRALKRGWSVLFERKSVVFHDHETTNATAIGHFWMSAASYKNHLLMVWKNVTSWKLWGTHLLWLPYHLVMTSYKSKGLFLVGFLWAIIQIPEVLPRRAKEHAEQVNRDEKVLATLGK